MRTALVLISVILAILVSCKPKEELPNKLGYSPTQSGFGVVVKEIGIDSGPGAGLYYKGTNETPTLVWPCIGTGGYPILYTNDIALLLADKPDARGYMGNGALIAGQGTGFAMDISDDILKIAASQKNADFKKLLSVYQPLRLNQVQEKLKVTYAAKMGSGYPPGLEVSVTWEQVFAIMQDVKNTGKIKKVVNTDVSYLQKDYDN